MLRNPAGAIAVSVLLVAGSLAASIALIVDAHGGSAPTLAGDQADPATPPGSPSLQLAGSGSNVPITRRLAAAFRRTHPGSTIVVHDSIGSTGAVRAVSDRAIDIGLLSRPLRPGEATGLSTAAYARIAVVAAAHPDVAATTLSPATLIAAYRGETRHWPDGSKLVVIQRERGDSSQHAVAAALPEFARANERAWRRGMFRVVYSDRAMEAALLATSGAVGISDAGVINVQRLPLRSFALPGITKTLSFIWRGTLPAAARQFLAFVRSSQGARILEAAGYTPIGERP